MGDRLKGKRVILVGAATGIGRETAHHIVREGAALVMADLNERDGAAAASEVGSGARFVPCDVADEASVESMVDEAARALGGLDVLINNAAIQYSGKVSEFDVARWDKIMAVNVRGPFLAAKHAVPRMRQAGGGSIVNTASLAGLRGGPGMTAYSATKGAVIAFTTSLAMELAPDKIRVNAICPGWVDTPFNNPAIEFMGGGKAQADLIKAFVPLGRQGIPSEIAPLFVYLASDESAFMTAQSIIIDGGTHN